VTGTTQNPDDLLIAAQAGDAKAAAALYEQVAADAHRVAATLTGGRRAADEVIRTLARQAAEVLPRWRSGDEATRWFVHHMVILTRQYPARPTKEVDVLLDGVGGPDVVQYTAIVDAVRKLPAQQREAVLLTHARRWNTRLCAVAMDCSNTAVETHLAEGERQIRPLAGPAFGPLMEYLHRVHGSYALTLPYSPAMFAGRVRRGRWGGSLKRVVAWAVIALVLIGAVVFFVYLRPRIEI
jgi:DNA-directed RNA polymerase specialized sigma24 family protein